MFFFLQRRASSLANPFHLHSATAVSLKAGFTAQRSSWLHLFSGSCTESSSALLMQEVPFHVLPVERRQQSRSLWFVQTTTEIVW